MNPRKAVLNQSNAPRILQLLDAQIPKVVEFEELIGARALQNPDVFPSTIDIVKPEDFFSLKIMILWRAMERVDAAGLKVDLVTVCEELQKQQHKEGESYLDYVGGMEWLGELASKHYQLDFAPHICAEFILAAAKRRRLAAYADTLRGLALDSSKTIEDIAIEAETGLGQTLETLTQHKERTFHDAMYGYLDHIGNMVDSGLPAGLLTGITNVDRITGGIQDGELTLLAGHKGMGKTALLLSIVAQLCSAGKQVVLFLLEQSEHDVMRWFTSYVSGVSIAKLRSGLIDVNDYRNILMSANKIEDWKLMICDDIPTLTPLVFKRRVTRLTRHTDVDFIAIDGLWLMQPDEKADNGGAKDINNIMRQLSLMMKKGSGFGLPLWLTHQFNQDAKNRNDKRPQLYDLEYGGAKDAHNVYGLYRENYFSRLSDTGHATELITLKARTGDYGTGLLRFQSPGYDDWQVQL